MNNATYELTFNPHDGTAFVYRNITAGVCGPCTTVAKRIHSLDDADLAGRRLGFTRVSEWKRTSLGYFYAEAMPGVNV